MTAFSCTTFTVRAAPAPVPRRRSRSARAASSACSRPASQAAQRLAVSSFGPRIEPGRSITSASFSGRRSAAAAGAGTSKLDIAWTFASASSGSGCGRSRIDVFTYSSRFVGASQGRSGRAGVRLSPCAVGRLLEGASGVASQPRARAPTRARRSSSRFASISTVLARAARRSSSRPSSRRIRSARSWFMFIRRR